MPLSAILSPSPPASPSLQGHQAGKATPSPVLHLALVVALYALPILIALRPVGEPIYDPDVWWHLRVGQWVSEHHTVPDHDPCAAGNKPWVAYSWLYEVLLWGLYQPLGLAGIILYRTLFALATVAVFHVLVQRFRPATIVAYGLTGAAAVALSVLFSERPWLFTIPLTALTVLAALDLRQRRRTWIVWLLPLAFVLWANTHIQFIYGLFVLGLSAAAAVIDRIVRRFPASSPEANWRGPVLLFIACALATLINPYHVRLYGVVIEYATQPGPFRWVNELQALDFRGISDWVVLGLGAAAAFALGRHSAITPETPVSPTRHRGGRHPLDTFEALLLIAAALFTFRARRDLWFLTLASLVVLARSAAASGAGERRLGWRGIGLASVLLALLALGTWWLRDLREPRLQQTVAAVFPVQAADAVRQGGHEGLLFNDFNWGGYLIWSLPHLPVALDGRTNLHGDERIVRIGQVWAGASGWQDDPDLAAAGVVVANIQTPLASLLLTDQRFVKVHEDDLARVFVRKARTKSPSSGEPVAVPGVQQP
jgi:hypothetical protein